MYLNKQIHFKRNTEDVIQKTSNSENDYMNYMTEKITNELNSLFNEKGSNNPENSTSMLPSNWEKHEGFYTYKDCQNQFSKFKFLGVGIKIFNDL